jgi:hypothetical protein
MVLNEVKYKPDSSQKEADKTREEEKRKGRLAEMTKGRGGGETCEAAREKREPPILRDDKHAGARRRARGRGRRRTSGVRRPGSRQLSLVVVSPVGRRRSRRLLTPPDTS